MPHRYIPRALEPTLRQAARQFPAVVLRGPRQLDWGQALIICFPGTEDVPPHAARNLTPS